MANKRKIAVLTGKRGGFGAMKPMLRLIQESEDLELQLIVTDQHLNNKFGRTVKEVEREFPIAAAVDMEQKGDAPVDRALALGRGHLGMTKALVNLTPDILVLYGDRGEVLVAATVATSLGIPIAHIQGGDLSGSVDEQVRHAVTKLSHLHFPSNKESADRILAMGEEKWRVHTVGDNHVDEIVDGKFCSSKEVAEQLCLDLERPIAIVLQHSETTEPEKSYSQMQETLLALKDTDYQTVVVHPCSDVGYQGILDAIADYCKDSNFQVHVNLDAPLFWGLLGSADVLVGNSSAGLVEAPYFKLPVINVGRRQEGRLRAENIIDVAHDRYAIKDALKQLSDVNFIKSCKNCSRPYGDGTAGKKISSILGSIDLDDVLVKRMTY